MYLFRLVCLNGYFCAIANSPNLERPGKYSRKNDSLHWFELRDSNRHLGVISSPRTADSCSVRSYLLIGFSIIRRTRLNGNQWWKFVVCCQMIRNVDGGKSMVTRCLVCDVGRLRVRVASTVQVTQATVRPAGTSGWQIGGCLSFPKARQGLYRRSYSDARRIQSWLSIEFLWVCVDHQIQLSGNGFRRK